MEITLNSRCGSFRFVVKLSARLFAACCLFCRCCAQCIRRLDRTSINGYRLTVERAKTDLKPYP
jgi:hypothetical protein